MPSDLTPPHGAPLDFDALALMHLDGQLDPVRHEAFGRQIAVDPEKARRLAMIAELHASLTELGHTSMTHPGSSISARSHHRSRRTVVHPEAKRIPAWGFAAAAVLALGIAVALGVAWSGRAPADVLHVAQGSVTLERGNSRVRLLDGNTPLKSGDRILTSSSTSARITTGHGDRLDLSSGTYLAWGSNHAAVDLRAGSFTADITPRAASAPFLITTPRADLLVVGTRFTVQADEALSLLAVDQGRVRLTNRDDARQVEVAARQLTVTTGTGDLAVTAGNLPVTTASGLTGDYFDHQDFTGWRLRRVDATIDFDWGDRGPDPRIGFEAFSVRWRGWLVPPASGSYTLTFLMDDGVRLWLDGRLVLDEWHLTEKLEFSTTVTLEGGRAYPLRLDFFQQPRDAVIRWYAAIDGQPRQTVPTVWLRPLEWTPPTK